MLKKQRLFLFAIVSGLVIFLLSCTATYNIQKEAEAIDDADVAIIYKEFDWGGGNVDPNSIQLYQIDDKPGPCKGIGCINRWYGSSWDGSYRIRLLPGEHTLYIRFKSNLYVETVKNGRRLRGYPVFQAVLRINAEAGHKYYIKADYDKEKDKPKVWVEDVKNH